MQKDVLQTAFSDGVLTITLNRPGRLNAFNPEMHAALAEALTRAEREDGVRAVLLTGAGRGFCAGQDLDERDPSTMAAPPDLGKTIGDFYNPLIRRLRGLDKPIVCAVNGVAAGAGANIAFACDIVLAAESAKFIQSFSKVGLVPDSGGTWTITHLVGEARAKAIMMLAEPVTAARAVDWGLIYRSVPDADLMNEAQALAARLAAGASFALGLTKKAVQAASAQTLDESLALEQDYQRRAGRSPDYAEGVRAFLEKRPARFSGKQG